MKPWTPAAKSTPTNATYSAPSRNIVSSIRDCSPASRVKVVFVAAMDPFWQTGRTGLRGLARC